MVVRLLRRRLAKKLNTIEAPDRRDCSNLASIRRLPILDVSQFGQTQEPETFTFPSLLLAKTKAEGYTIPVLDNPPRETIDLITQASIPVGNLLLYRAEVFTGISLLTLAPVADKVSTDGLPLLNADVITGALNEGLPFQGVGIVDAFRHVQKLERLRIFQYVNFLKIPEITTPFKLLARPKTVGRDYRPRYVPEEEKRLTRQPRLQGFERKCRHGIVRSLCSICIEARARAIQNRNKRQTRVVDVFEQLFYILQPPILPQGGRPIIFPNGKKPFPFQIVGVKWLVEHKSALLADEMGLGKTVQAIIAMRILFRRGELQRTVVVCPASMTITWEREIKSWAPELRVFRVHGHQATRSEMWKSNSEIYVVSYETLRNDVGTFDPTRFDLCVLDEAQKIKNPAAKVHRAVKQLSPKYRWALTGTPVENDEGDVIALFSFLKPGLFHEENSDWNARTEIRRKISSYTLRRTVDDVEIELPQITRQEHWLDLLPSQSNAYRAIEFQEVEALKRMGVDATRIHIFAIINKLKQICNYDETSGQSCKLNFLEDELNALSENGDRALVFSQYPEKTLKVIEPKLQRYKPVTYSGSLSANRREEILDRFQHEPEHEVLLMSLKAGGVGLTLTRANHVFLYDHWWNPATMDQAVGRVRRIGQSKPVFSHSIYTADTIEERIHNLLQEKRTLFHELLGRDATSDEDLSHLTDKDLFGLFDMDVPIDHQESTACVSNTSQPSQLDDNPLMQTQSINGSVRWPTELIDASPTEFEEAIRDLFHWWKGYLLHTTPASNDGGIDLDGFRQYGSQGRVMIQCKRYTGTVSVGQVREFYGAVAIEGDVAETYMVTTGKFSNKAIRYAR